MSKFRFVQDETADRGYLIGLSLQQKSAALRVEDSLRELSLLAKTAGIRVLGQTCQYVRRINPKTFIGSGKLQEIIEEIAHLDINMVIFDDELSPRHQRELEKQFGEDVRLVDRSALILDIFARHARTREGALQVELAQYEYRLPRLTRQWTHLARQAGSSGAGGVGLRGPGETQLEVDRREINRKITKLRRDLEHVRAHRSLHREKRRASGLPLVALVGYTNAGKSTLMNALSHSDIYAADQLFATLDPTIRRIALPDRAEALLSDTVGFIQKLPAMLIAAFRATLEEVVEADLLLHVADVSHPNVMQQIEAVEDTLAEIDAAHMPRILVLNKIDRLDDALPELDLVDIYQDVVPISAQKNLGLGKLLDVVGQVLARQQTTLRVLIPYDRGKEYSHLYDKGYIQAEGANEQGWQLTLNIPDRLSAYYQKYRVDESE